MIRTFQSKDRVVAIEFLDADKSTILEVVKLTGFPVTIEYAINGTVRAGIIRSSSDIRVFSLGQYVYKDSKGTFDVCDYEHLIENYEEVTAP